MPDWSDGRMTPGSAVVAAVHEALSLVAVYRISVTFITCITVSFGSALCMHCVWGCIGGGVGPLFFCRCLALSVNFRVTSKGQVPTSA